MNPYFIQPPRIPPLDEETQKQIKQLTKEDMKKIRNSDVVQKILADRKIRKRQARKKWFSQNLFTLINLVLSFIAAVASIIALFV